MAIASEIKYQELKARASCYLARWNSKLEN